MSATNATTYYELPVFIATDKPAWLTDWNGAMNAIDTAIKEALTAGENAQTTANTATISIATINDSLTTINTSLTTLTSTVTGLVGSVNTINSLIGNGEPTTSDKTLIGAINEIYGMITGGGGGAEIQAQNVVYDNTTSGLTADDVQEAIDELHNSSAIAYDNTTSGLTATDVQSAIDEIAQGGSGGGANLDLSSYSGTATVTAVAGTIYAGATEANYALNSDKSIGKIFGTIYLTGVNIATSGWNKVATISASDLPTRSASKNLLMGFSFSSSNDGYVPRAYRLVFNTDGTIDVEMNFSASVSNVEVTISLIPCLYLLSQGL